MLPHIEQRTRLIKNLLDKERTLATDRNEEEGEGEEEVGVEAVVH